MMICPECKGRATKIWHLNTGNVQCQQCDYQGNQENFYAHLTKRKPRNGRKRKPFLDTFRYDPWR